MKRPWCVVLVLLYVLNLILAGCGNTEENSKAEQESVAAIVPSARDSGDGLKEYVPEIESTGKIRISYTGNRSTVRYITSASQLPDYEVLEAFNEEYFQTGALILVVETVSNGSVDVAISRITVDGNRASVTLSHEMRADAGTADMATWLLWAEVDRGMDCQWVLENPALKSDSAAY